MKILVVDDETPARERLCHLVGELGEPYQVIGEAANGEEALACCREQDVELLLLDIRMLGKDGLSVAAELARWETPPAVIFTTAYEEHALDAFEKNAVDYLLKPIRRQRLAVALQRAATLTRAQVQAIEALRHPVAEAINVSYRGGLLRIPLDDIIYFKAEQKYVTVRHIGGEALVEDSLKALEERFGSRFLRVRRNALIACDRLIGLVKMADSHALASLDGTDEQLEISRRHLPEVRRWLKRNGS
ncbi:LytR/AlgR family response regulator transcription factor [Solemya velesiana gill symbiont]|uniref:DNA-binding response regulator n=1 Tax=Solemya velesiana gill symbiont TaxID=1918948 RepID=A0A1T2KUP8_9GAMM|nr:LytTR family DNA-binding domain-containing protein [Solemya velesiana gill symbiont]OOZ36575.1 DNA-binding response regulator [Solemya velesiana gill symbiont]